VEDFGLRRFTIDDVARRAGVSRVTIYRYFPRRERLIEAVVLHELHRFLRRIDAVVRPLQTTEERLVEGFVHAVLDLRSHRLLARLLRTESELILPQLTVRAGPVLAAAREFIAGYARDDARRGGLRLEEPQIEGVSELLARAVLTFVLTPNSVLPMETEPEVRTFAQTYLAPVLQYLSGTGV
jgi:AcrR family transcriptional regulator